MGYRVVDADAVEPEPDRPCECRKLSDPGDLDAAAINRFRAAPGEQLPLAYHYHETQQEAFYVLDGTLAVETPERTYEVSADDLFVVDPESPQRAHNPADADVPVTVLAIGAPPADGDAVAYDPDESAAADDE
ncbi:mannose-6-phosphate isomerase-like protein (cupin superfamily) [Halorubrum trapanicum]|uniref:Mannose-6-phosphate isomerase-like protein (Cupin superfamily) n=1 Tax=Halorubrum trapanicum TaxID=29284 RepID=A0A8J7RT15_9EURY|nr:cupin domain-containing protein [Halorubrum trapanicum]MBP1903027.1 mannose-6-phosphate isomerase-like protein (cupin superfamily) [Halorubrum trapanicum]